MIVGVAAAILIGLLSVGRSLWKSEETARVPLPKVPLEVVAPAQRKPGLAEPAARKPASSAGDADARPLVREPAVQPESRAAEEGAERGVRERVPGREYAALPPVDDGRVVDVRERLPAGASVSPVKPLDPKQVARERAERAARERELKAQREREMREAREREELAAREAKAARERAAARAAEEENARRAAAAAAAAAARQAEEAARAAEQKQAQEPVAAAVDWQDNGGEQAARQQEPFPPQGQPAADAKPQAESEELAVAVLERSQLEAQRPVEPVASLGDSAAPAAAPEQVARAVAPQPEENPAVGSGSGDVPAAAGEQIVTARPGDSISGIAIQKYGAANHTVLDLLKMANPSVRDIDRIAVGQQLRVPKLDEGVAVVQQEKGDYAVLVLSTPDQKRANGIEAAMRKRGFHAEVRRTDFGSGRNVYRLVMPGFRDYSTAVNGGKQLQRLIREDDQFANMAR